MKKITLLAVAALAISFASCKKDYTCACTTTSTSPSGTTTSSSSTTIHAKKSDAQKACDADNSSGGSGGYTSTIACTLK